VDDSYKEMNCSDCHRRIRQKGSVMKRRLTSKPYISVQISPLILTGKIP
jgi:hypothetical protein